MFAGTHYSPVKNLIIIRCSLFGVLEFVNAMVFEQAHCTSSLDSEIFVLIPYCFPDFTLPEFMQAAK